jgi:hypothetical protein
MSLPPVTDIPQQLQAATNQWAKLRRLAAYAAFDGWSLTVLGTLTLICGGYGTAPGLLVSMALLGTGIFEIQSVGRLRRLNPNAIPHMAYNQLVLAGGLILYAIINIIQARHGGSAMTGELQQALAMTGSDSAIDDQLTSIMQIFYTALIAIALMVQGGTAIYYFSRQKFMLQYLAQTPDWIQQMQRERGEVSL